MRCYTHQLAFAAATAMVIFYAIGALLITVFPTQILQVWAPLFYLRTADIFLPFVGISIASLLSGAIQSFIYTYLYAWILGTIYNLLTPTDL